MLAAEPLLDHYGWFLVTAGPSGQVEQARKQHIVGFAGKAQHQSAARGLGANYAIVQEGFHCGACGSRSHSQQGRNVTTFDLSSQEDDAQQVPCPVAQTRESSVANQPLSQSVEVEHARHETDLILADRQEPLGPS